MTLEHHVKLFKNGRSQAVHIPPKFELPGEDAFMRKEGPRIIIESAPTPSLLARLKTLQPINDDCSPIDDHPADAVAF